MSKTEINHFLRILPDYYKYIKENETTFIAKIFGIFAILAAIEPKITGFMM
jgi:hypothetical protein